jgi:hypothetical protein
MSFFVSFIGKDKERASAHLQDLAGSRHYVSVPSHIWGFLGDAIAGIRQEGPISVTAQGHIVGDANSYEVSTCTIEVKPLGTQFIE